MINFFQSKINNKYIKTMGFWDIVKENPNGTFVIAILGLAAMKQCWDSMWYYKSIINIAQIKLELAKLKVDKGENIKEIIEDVEVEVE